MSKPNSQPSTLNPQPLPGETHILSIRSHLDDATLFLSPGQSRGMVVVQIRHPLGSVLPPQAVLIPAEALLLAARSLHAIITEENPS